jgi:hypothetical protein
LSKNSETLPRFEDFRLQNVYYIVTDIPQTVGSKRDEQKVYYANSTILGEERASYTFLIADVSMI